MIMTCSTKTLKHVIIFVIHNEIPTAKTCRGTYYLTHYLCYRVTSAAC